MEIVELEGLVESTHLLGRRADVPALMNALDLHVLSSVGEAFPNVVAEAMASGTPCVVTNVGDAAEIVGETGWSVPAKDSAALASAVSTALQELEHQPQRWTERRLAARSRIVDNFSLEQMVVQYNKVWTH
jgi:glycosyltransferase involved in cell wall biosynthesis